MVSRTSLIKLHGWVLVLRQAPIHNEIEEGISCLCLIGALHEEFQRRGLHTSIFIRPVASSLPAFKERLFKGVDLYVKAKSKSFQQG